MIPSDHFVRFYNEVFKFLDARNALEPYYREISRHQEMHCLELFRKEGLKGKMKYYERIRVEENCGLELELLPDRMISHMTKCPSLSKVLDSDAEPCAKYCDHCAGWFGPLSTKCGIYYVENIISRNEPRCESVTTESREVAQQVYEKFLAEAAAPDLVKSNLGDWEEVEKNKVYREDNKK